MNQRTLRKKKNRTAGYLFPAVLFFYTVILTFPAVTSAGDRLSASLFEAAADSAQVSMIQTEPEPDQPVSVSKKTCSIDGLDRTYRLLLVSDLHIIVPDDPQVDPECTDIAESRLNQMFRTPSGESAFQLWQTLPSQLDSMKADMILFAGDMVDFATKASTASLKAGFDSLKTPWMYVRGDHDYAAWYSKAYETQKDAILLQKNTAPRKKVMRQKIGNLTIIGWDNNTAQMTKKGLRDLSAYLQEAKAEKSPVLFLCHVPLKGTVTDKLEQESKQKNGRALLWGDGGCYYRPDDTTKQALDLIQAADSPVVLEASGHLHFPYSGPLTETSTIITADPAFQNQIDELVLVPGHSQ